MFMSLLKPELYEKLKVHNQKILRLMVPNT